MGSSLPIQNSPPGIQTIPGGALPGSAAVLLSELADGAPAEPPRKCARDGASPIRLGAPLAEICLPYASDAQPIAKTAIRRTAGCPGILPKSMTRHRYLG